jgi:hypothetical protein
MWLLGKGIIMKRLAFAVFSCVFFVAYANTYLQAQGNYTANSCNYSDVNAVINGPTHVAVDGDTINIPQGTCTWASGIVVPSGIGIAIVGDGTPNSSSSTTGAAGSCTTTTITVAGGVTLFTMTPEYGSATSHISCMQLTYSSGAAVVASVQGSCTSGGCANLRMDNLTLTNWAGHTEAGISYGLSVVGDMFGVIDHNTVNGSAGNYLQLVEENNASYLGTGQWGDNSWAQPEGYGSANFLFFENNIFNDAGCCENEGGTGALQTRGGGRVVVRYNTFTITDSYNYAMTWHGTESNQRARGGRAFEFYENNWTCEATCQQVADIRSGTGLFWGNTATVTSGNFSNGLFVFNTYRTQGSPSPQWGPCDGSTVYDTNDGTTYYSGTISSVSGNTITVSGSPGWSTNQWYVNGAPYSVHDVTQGSGAEIGSNTSNTITVNSAGGPGSYVPAGGDSIQILRATVCIDQAGGRGAGSLYTGVEGASGDVPATPASAASNAHSPTYFWMNTQSGFSSLGIGSDTARIIQNRDYYTENLNQAAQASSASPFNGSSGAGHGTLANRPAACTTGVSYFATDQGSQGELFTCTSTNAWAISYTPFTYPHPLITGTAPPSAPTGLQAVVQ